MKCQLLPQGVPQGSCLTETTLNTFKRACEVTLPSNGQYTRLIKSNNYNLYLTKSCIKKKQTGISRRWIALPCSYLYSFDYEETNHE